MTVLSGTIYTIKRSRRCSDVVKTLPVAFEGFEAMSELCDELIGLYFHSFSKANLIFKDP